MSSHWSETSFSACLERISREKMDYVVKRLSGNDTGLTGGHQAGIYLPRQFFEKVLPEINTTKSYNPRVSIECLLPVNGADVTTLSAIFYNSKFFPERKLKKKYNEFRLTGWGGRKSPVQNDENTGCVFVFAVGRDGGNYSSIALVAESEGDEKLVEEWLGECVEPGRIILSGDGSAGADVPFDFPNGWVTTFPNGRGIFDFVVEKLPRLGWGKSIDELLLARRNLEFQIYSEVEKEHVLPNIRDGFDSVEDFMKIALSVANRRKSRTGTSLELNLASIFDDEGVHYDEQVVTEHRKKPDFIFPSAESYFHEPEGSSKLTMLAAKTCCKDRWRQVISEAQKIQKKHLFTLQEGVSPNQLVEMEAGGIQLVVPAPNLRAFPKDWRNRILDLSSFVELVKGKQILP